jgi:CheY-like chemotaxis protein
VLQAFSLRFPLFLCSQHHSRRIDQWGARPRRDLVLLDVMMPEMQRATLSVSLSAEIKAATQLHNNLVIIQSRRL